MNQTTYVNNIRRIAILAYADTRKELIEWSYAKKNILKNNIIISTARTASILEGTLNTPVVNLNHGRSGGYEQVRNLLEENKIDIIMFYGNSQNREEYETAFDELVEVAIKNNVVVAYNQATIDMVLTSIDVRNENRIAQKQARENIR